MNNSKGFMIAFAIAGFLLLANAVYGAAGDQLWETKFNFLPQYNTIKINAMSVSQTTLIVCGNASNPSLTAQIAFIKGFNVTTGVIAWHDEFSISGNDKNNFTAIKLVGDIAIVVGYSTDSGPTVHTNKGFLRAYNATTGQFLWEAQRDAYLGGNELVTISMPVMATDNNRAFLAVNEINDMESSTGNWIVRAFQAKNIMVPLLLLD
jgi:outer membrane protein assembly factor BamB